MIEPLPALAAVLVLGIALGVYADAMASVDPARSASGTAAATLQSVHDRVSEDGAALPGRVPDARDAGPAGYRVNLTLSTGSSLWSAGPTPPDRATEAGRTTPVRIDQWTVRPGRLRVVVWT